MKFEKLFSCVKAAIAAVIFLGAAGSSAWAGGDATCSGGSIASGVYSNLNIAGTCAVDSGSVTVQHNLTVLPGATLVAVKGGIDGFGDGSLSSDLTVGGNLDVQAGAVLYLGCEPVYNSCPNDPTAPPFPAERLRPAPERFSQAGERVPEPAATRAQ